MIKGGFHDDNLYLSQNARGEWLLPQVVDIGYIDDKAALKVDGRNRPHIVADAEGLEYRGVRLIEASDDMSLSQRVVIPAEMETPILSFYYQRNGLASEPENSFELWLDDGTPIKIGDYQDLTADWQHEWIDLSAWRGQEVELAFKVHLDEGAVLESFYLDEVSLGSALPDVWVDVDTADGVAGSQVVHLLSYGNRGGATADNVILTYTLPPELTFVSASVEPVSLNPLRWELGDVVARSNGEPIKVTVAVAETAVPLTTLTPQATIVTSDNEPEQLNNQASGTMYVGAYSYLPLIVYEAER